MFKLNNLFLTIFTNIYNKVNRKYNRFDFIYFLNYYNINITK